MSVEFQIKVSMDVLKQLTARLEEGQSYDDVIRELLSLDSIIEPERAKEPLEIAFEQIDRSLQFRSDGFVSRGLWLPNSTQLRARYKQREFRAEIRNGDWIDQNGAPHSSPSAAATAVTSTNVNGLRFWEAKRPTDKGWRRLDVLVQP